MNRYSPELALSPARTKDLFSRGLIPAPGEGADVLSRLPGISTFGCKAGVGQCFIAADGRGYACHYFQNIGEAMGDLSQETLENIYRRYPLSGAAPVSLDRGKLENCKACAHFTKCRGGCRARAKILSGGWYNPDAFSCGMYGVERSDTIQE